MYVHMCVYAIDADLTYPESKVLQALGQTGQELVSGASSRDECEGGGRSSEISTGKLCACRIARLVCERA